LKSLRSWPEKVNLKLAKNAGLFGKRQSKANIFTREFSEAF